MSIHDARYRKNRAVVIRRDMGLCVRCLILHDKPVPGSEVDHLLNRARQVDHSLDNLWLLCEKCHIAKTVLERFSKGTESTEQIFPTEIDPMTGWTRDTETDEAGNAVDSYSYWKRVIEQKNSRSRSCDM